MKIGNITLTVLILAGLFIPVQTVRADIAPPPEVELGGLQPPQFQQTEVAMLYERVEMEMGMYYDETAPTPIQNRVLIEAYFLMKNLGNVDESMQAVFPSESNPICRGNTHGERFTAYYIVQDSFQVGIDGITVPTTIVKAPYGDCNNFPWLAFDIIFPVQKEVLVKVSYEMRTWNVDAAQNIDYVLDTGAGWNGKIGRGYVILKFPYAVTSENVLSSSTEGFQTFYNEIFWSFQNLEPTSESNIHISVVSPNVWLDIKRLRAQLERVPESPDAWIQLIEAYRDIGLDEKGDFVRDKYYFDLTESAYQTAIAENPNSAELHARYAEYRLYNWSPRLSRQLTENEATQLLSLLNKAFALEPNNETAKNTMSSLLGVAPFITFTPPPTVPPTATLLFTTTPTMTPSVTITPVPSETPVVITVVHTKIVKALTSTQLPQVTATLSLVETESKSESQNNSNPSSLIFGAFVIFGAGLGLGLLFAKSKKK